MHEYNKRLPRELKHQLTLQKSDAERRFLNLVFIMKRLEKVQDKLKDPGGKNG